MGSSHRPQTGRRVVDAGGVISPPPPAGDTMAVAEVATLMRLVIELLAAAEVEKKRGVDVATMLVPSDALRNVVPGGKFNRIGLPFGPVANRRTEEGCAVITLLLPEQLRSSGFELSDSLVGGCNVAALTTVAVFNSEIEPTRPFLPLVVVRLIGLLVAGVATTMPDGDGAARTTFDARAAIEPRSYFRLAIGTFFLSKSSHCDSNCTAQA